ncbi:MAG TPA: nucleotide sugar dehydrogenase [Polyangiaceae bacterium]|jgi:UDP-N-acetyl-D-glucosamine dehydrogenase
MLLEKIQNQTAHVVVVGIGYVGLPLVVELARAGFKVTGFDHDERKVKLLAEGRSYIEDIASEDLAPHVKTGKLHASIDERVLGQADCVVLCVPTPLKKTKDPDMTFIEAAADAVSRHQHKDMLVVLESTTYPGTTREVLCEKLGGGFVVGKDVFVAFSPERVDPGNAKFGTRNTPKVLGGVTPACMEVAGALYKQIVDRVVPVSSPDAAEMTKLLENTFRAVNIGLVNEFALICERLGLDVWEIIEAASTKPFGFMPFRPGPGLGGHCIPIDPLYLSWKMRGLKVPARFIELADMVNTAMPEHVVELVARALNDHEKSMKGSKLLVSGVAYKKDISDVRESPAIDVIAGLLARGANVAYLDPFVPSFKEHGHSFESIDTKASFAPFDAVVIVTDHTGIDYARMVREAKVVVDTRNATRAHAGSASAKIVRL